MFKIAGISLLRMAVNKAEGLEIIRLIVIQPHIGSKETAKSLPEEAFADRIAGRQLGVGFAIVGNIRR